MPEEPRSTYNRQPLLLLAGCFAGGILLARSTGIADPFLPFVLAAVLAAAALFFRKSGSATVLALFAFTAAGAFVYALEIKRNNAPDRIRTIYEQNEIVSGTPVEIDGIVIAAPEVSHNAVLFTLRATNVFVNGVDRDVSGNVRVFAFDPGNGDPLRDVSLELSEMGYGSRIRIACALQREDQYLDPGVARTRELLDRQDLDATCGIRSPKQIELMSRSSAPSPLNWVFSARSLMIEKFRTNLNAQTAGVMIASLLGDKYLLDRDTAELFRDGGTFHILVISGLHITFIGGILLLIIRRFTRSRWLQFAVTSVLVWSYSLAVGADVPVVRAAIMFTIVLTSFAVYRRTSILNSVGFCALILLAWRPSDMFGASFQLTFASVGAIVSIAYPLITKMKMIGEWTPTSAAPFPAKVPRWLLRLCETIYWEPAAWSVEMKRNIWSAHIQKEPYFGGRIAGNIQRALRYIFDGLLVSSVVQICILPLSIIYFHRVPFASVILNIWVGFWIAVESIAAVAGVTVGIVSERSASIFYALTEAANWIMLLLPRAFSAFEWSSIRLPAYTGYGRATYFLLLVLVVIAAAAVGRWQPFDVRSRFPNLRKVVAFSVGLCVLLATIIAHLLSVPFADGRIHVDILDVGQGDSALVTFPNGETLLIDGGGKIEFGDRARTEDAFVPDRQTIGEAVVSQVLWTKGYSRLNYVLATHADADHIQGLLDVVRNFAIGRALLGRTPMSDPEYADLDTELRKRNVPVQIVSRGDRFEIGGAIVEVLYPVRTDDPNAISDNDHSVVLRIIFGSRIFLFTGDIERAAEADLLSGGELNAGVVKVPHHGSKTSSTPGFVEAVGAKYAVISVGRRSIFGHPDPSVVERWTSSGAVVATTGVNGAISFTSDGTDLMVGTYGQ